MKVLAQYNLRKGFCLIVDDIPEDCQKGCGSWDEVKQNYLKSKGLCINEIKNFVFQFPPDGDYEENTQEG